MSDSKSSSRSARKADPSRSVAESAPRPLRIGEAARLLGVEAYVLRFWETQFPFLRPRHSRSRHRFYLAKDIDTLRLIKRLLHKERYTIEGARKHIREVGLESMLASASAKTRSTRPSEPPRTSAAPDAVPGKSVKRALNEMRRELEDLHKLLES